MSAEEDRMGWSGVIAGFGVEVRRDIGVVRRRQSYDRTVFYATAGPEDRLWMVRINVDSRAEQSYVELSLWSGSRWESVLREYGTLESEVTVRSRTLPHGQRNEYAGLLAGAPSPYTPPEEWHRVVEWSGRAWRRAAEAGLVIFQ